MKVGNLVSPPAVPTPSQNRLLVPLTICFRSVLRPFSALVDSGAEQSFIDHDLAAELGVPLIPLPCRLETRALNGTLIAPITHQIEPLHIIVSGNHHEQLSFFVMPLSQSPIILGLSWLTLHNPHLDWCSQKIIGWSTLCHSFCLHSALPPSTDLNGPPAWRAFTI